MSVHRLEGLEPDNWLAFMALLGLLRALDSARPEWHARAHWDDMVRPLRPVLTLAQDADSGEVANAAAEGIATLSKIHVFARKDLKYCAKHYRRARMFGDPMLCDALLSDGAIDEDGNVIPTPLCFLFGQGHQHFLERLASIPKETEPKQMSWRRRTPDRQGRNYVGPNHVWATLFEPWRREDRTHGLRWDPAEDRRYALRARDPSGDPGGMQHGANQLASVALPLLSGAVVRRRAEARFLNRATAYGQDGEIMLTWPIWSRPARLTGITALLAHPELAKPEPDLDRLAPLGVLMAYRARRISVGKYFNVTWATPFTRTAGRLPHAAPAHRLNPGEA